MGKLVATETKKVKAGRFDCTVTKEFYSGEEERAAQVKALTALKKFLLSNKGIDCSLYFMQMKTE
jgi:hypothetical protein